MTETATAKLIAHDPITTIAAGGIAALNAKLAPGGALPASPVGGRSPGIDQRTSPITARAYRHPGLDNKVVIRLEPDAVAGGTDAEMAAFGFEAPKVTPALGQVRYRTLGFPAWALVNDPKKAKAALDVTEDMRKAKRMVASKPGHAKEAFEKIAKQLQRTAPQFLPSFWEEVARVVADQASSSMAAQCFERARQAERAYKLKIDPEDGDAAFVEFALLGALSAKTLSAYAKDLTKSAGGAEAYRRFRAIVVKRALGGMPPYSGMGKDLRALAKAADLDQQAEDDSLAADLVEAPGVGKAPIEFWTTYRDALLRLAKTRPEIVARLRVIWPEPRGGNDEKKQEFTASWMDLLEAVGGLTGAPDDGLGGWVSRMIKFAGKTPRVEAVLRAEAERLGRLNQKISVVCQISWGDDLHMDLAELALGLGIPLADPGEYDDFAAESMTVDPVLVAAHPVYGKKLVESVANMIGESEHEHRMRGKSGFTAARRRWLEEQIAAIDGKPFPNVESRLETLESKTTAETFLAFPDLHERLAKVDLATSLANQLRSGIADEFGWPAYEEAAKALGKQMNTGGAFPIMTVWNTTKAIALGPTGVIAEHDFVYKPKEHKLERVWFLDGQFLVDLDLIGEYETWQYWSAKPKDKFKQTEGFRAWGGNLPNQWSPPGGGVTLGGKVFRAGDTEISGSCDFMCDGTSMWIEDNDKLYLYDPIKGAKVKPESPPFITEYEREGLEVSKSSVLFPVPQGLASSPLGMREGLLGIRMRTKKDDYEAPNEYERIDGARMTISRGAFALVDFPGGDKPRPIDAEEANNERFLGNEGPGVELIDESGDVLARLNNDDWTARGWGDALVPPATFWDFLTPRDPAGSAALRGITSEAARAILDAAKRDVDAAGDAKVRELPQTEAAIRAAIPAITNAQLVRGIAGIAERAAELAAKVATLVAERSKENADPGGQGLLGDAAQLRKLAGALAAGRAVKIKDFDIDPIQWLVNVRARAALSLSPLAEADERRKAREMVQALSGTIFADDLSRMRYLSLEEPDDYENPNDYDTLVIEKIENSVFAIHAGSDWALELSTDGVFRVPPPFKISEEKKLTKGIGTVWADRFLELPDEPVAWDPAIATKLAERADLSVAEAILFYINVPSMSTYSKDFLGKKHRELLGGLKVGDASAALTTFEQIDEDKMLELFERAVPDDPTLLRTPTAPGGLAERLGDAWKAKYGKRAKIPQDLIAAAKKELDISDELGKLLPAFAGAADDAWFLKPDLRPLPELDDWSEDGLNTTASGNLATLIAWLFLARPVGCPIRAGIPEVVKRLRAVVDDPRLVWPLERRYVDDDDKKEVARQQGILEAIGGKPVDNMPKEDEDPCLGARDDGTCIVAAYKNSVFGGFRPLKLDAKTKKKVEQLAQLLTDEDDDSGDALAPVKRIELLRSESFAAFGERVAETPVPEGAFEANPMHSVPKLVAKVAKALSIGDDAAMLYLQTLALAEPTQARVQAWNGWKPKQYATAGAELAKKKLVTEGKRERAGRSIFIKGGYSKGDGKNLPMEEWKQPFYTAISRHLPTEPVHLLFARAWKRVEDGDKP